MRSMDAQWASIAVTAAFSLAALLVSLRGQRQSRRSADAAERSAAVADQALELARAEAERSDVAWRLEAHSRDRVTLTNTGKDPAYSVSIDIGDMREMRSDRLEHSTIGPGSAVSFGALLHLNTSDDTVTVTWTEKEGGEMRSWRHPRPRSPT